MLSDTDLAKLLVNWKSQMGTEIRGRICIPYDSAIRINLYRDLIETLTVKYGYSEEDLLAFITERLIMEVSVPANTPGKATIIKMAKDDWHQAVAERFPMEILKHDPSKIDTSRRMEHKPVIETSKIEEPLESTIPEISEQEDKEEILQFAIEQEEFQALTEKLHNPYDIEFLADMLSVPLKELTDKQSQRLNKVRKKALHLKSVKDKKSTNNNGKHDDMEWTDPRLLIDNPIDRSIFEGMPPINDEIDEEFMKLIKGVTGE